MGSSGRKTTDGYRERRVNERRVAPSIHMVACSPGARTSSAISGPVPACRCAVLASRRRLPRLDAPARFLPEVGERGSRKGVRE